MAHILIVEDDAHIRLFIRINLTRRGYQVIEAGSAEEALALIQHNPPQLMLLDLRLPQMGGLELLDILAKENQVAIPVIILSAWAREQGAEIITNYAQVVDVIPKPVHAGLLLTSIRQAIAEDKNWS